MSDVNTVNEPERPGWQRTSAAAADPHPGPLSRRLVAEAVGTGLLVAVVVGSGIAAQQLSAGDVGLQLLENSTATVLGLAVLILIFGPVSGAHFNPVVSAADWFLGRWSTRRAAIDRTTGQAATGARRAGLSGRDLLAYVVAQAVGAVAGALLANAMYGLDAVQVSGRDRASWSAGLSEVVATGGLVLLIFALARTGRGALSAAAVGAYIGSAYWFTASTSFANPAVTIGRIFSDTFAGIAPASVPAFVLAQILGAIAGLALVLSCFPDLARPAPAAAAAEQAVAADLGEH